MKVVVKVPGTDQVLFERTVKDDKANLIANSRNFSIEGRHFKNTENYDFIIGTFNPNRSNSDILILFAEEIKS